MSARPGADSYCNLQSVYQRKAHDELQKVELAKVLVDRMMSPTTRRKIESRPIVEIPERVERLALMNHPPTKQEDRTANQRSKWFARKA